MTAKIMAAHGMVVLRVSPGRHGWAELQCGKEERRMHHARDTGASGGAGVE